MGYLPYEEPGITTLLSLASLLILLNLVHWIFDKVLYCGLIGQILIGIVWGIPVGGTAWLTEGTQHAIQAFGYLGLICLVFEGGLSTDLVQFKKTLTVSVSVATIGLLLPIALSFILLAIPFQGGEGIGNVYPTPLAAFSAGAALCSTSLGTTFAILSSAGMQKSRTGTILIGAAMMDDVVGLVMVNIVKTLGEGSATGWGIATPIVASFGMLLVTSIIAPYLLKPVWLLMVAFYRSKRVGCKTTQAAALLRTIPHLEFMLSTFVLIAYVTIAAFIHASVLFAAFIAGGIVTYLWALGDPPLEGEHSTGSAEMYEEYYRPMAQYVLVPFFFASIGFSIPITSMFRGSIVWKGIIYAILMVLAKVAVALVIYADAFIRLRLLTKRTALPIAISGGTSSPPTSVTPTVNATSPETMHQTALIIACAMVARGEIGYLIASLAQSSGTLEMKPRGGGEALQNEDIFLVIIWAVTLCTIGGPVAVGSIVKGMKKKRDAAVALPKTETGNGRVDVELEGVRQRGSGLKTGSRVPNSNVAK